MTVADRLRALATALPAHGAVTLTRDDIEELLACDAGAACDVMTPAGVDLTAADVAARLSRSQSTVREWCAAGRFPNAYRMNGREWRIPSGDLATFQLAEAARFRDPAPTRPALGSARELTTDAWRSVRPA